MFKKIISRLPYSPSMIHSLGFYAKRLRKEEATRKIGLILTALALIVQSFTVFHRQNQPTQQIPVTSFTAEFLAASN